MRFVEEEIGRSNGMSNGWLPDQATYTALIKEAPECTSGHPAQVGYSDTPRSTGVVMGRAWARAWVVWGDMTQRQPRTCDAHMRVDMRSGAFNGRRSARGMAPQVDDARCDVGLT